MKAREAISLLLVLSLIFIIPSSTATISEWEYSNYLYSLKIESYDDPAIAGQLYQIAIEISSNTCFSLRRVQGRILMGPLDIRLMRDPSRRGSKYGFLRCRRALQVDHRACIQFLLLCLRYSTARFMGIFGLGVDPDGNSRAPLGREPRGTSCLHEPPEVTRGYVFLV